MEFGVSDAFPFGAGKAITHGREEGKKVENRFKLREKVILGYIQGSRNVPGSRGEVTLYCIAAYQRNVIIVVY